MANVDIDLSPIIAKARKAFNEVVDEFAADCTAEIVASKWENAYGETVDIVDTGALRDSLNIKKEQDDSVVSWDPVAENGDHYALWVHEGIRFRNGKLMPARPWTKEPLTKVIPNFIRGMS